MRRSRLEVSEGMLRKLGLAVFLATAAAVGPASSAQAATVVGQTAPLLGCHAPGYGGAVQNPPTVPSYIVPSDGTITSWSAATDGAGAQTKLLVLQPGTVGHFQVVAKSDFGTFTSTGVQTFPTQISVRAGQWIGDWGKLCWFTSSGGDAFFSFAGPEPATGADQTFPDANGPGLRLDLSATVELDADHDTFGDETQDKCVGTAGPTNGCPNTPGSASAAQVGKLPLITVTVAVPGAGTLKAGDASDASVASASAVSLTPVTKTLTSTTSQQVPLLLSLTKQAKKRLRKKGKLKVQVKVVYTPPGGTAGPAQVLPVKLKAKKRK